MENLGQILLLFIIMSFEIVQGFEKNVLSFSLSDLIVNVCLEVRKQRSLNYFFVVSKPNMTNVNDLFYSRNYFRDV